MAFSYIWSVTPDACRSPWHVGSGAAALRSRTELTASTRAVPRPPNERLRRPVVVSLQMDQLPVEAKDASEHAVTQSARNCGNGIENGLHVIRRRTNDRRMSAVAVCCSRASVKTTSD